MAPRRRSNIWLRGIRAAGAARGHATTRGAEKGCITHLYTLQLTHTRRWVLGIAQREAKTSLDDHGS